MPEYQFKTEYFGLTNSELIKLRSGFPIDKFHFHQISSIEIKKGVRTKFPIRSFLFGCVMMVIVYFLIPNKDFILFDPLNAAIDIGYLIIELGEFGEFFVMFGFLFAIGIAAIIIAFKKTLVMKVVFNDNRYEVWSIKRFSRNNEIFELISFLKIHFGNRFSNKSTYGKTT